MPERVCRSCAASLGEGARFCSFCGASVAPGRSERVAQAIAAGVVLLELLAMGAMRGFVVPRLQASFADYGAPPGGVSELMLHPTLLPAFMVVVALIGGLAVLKRASAAQRVILVSAALVIGLVPMFGTVAALYILPLQIAGAIR